MDPPILLSVRREGASIELRLDAEPFSASEPDSVTCLVITGREEDIEAASQPLSDRQGQIVEGWEQSAASGAGLLFSISFGMTEVEVRCDAVQEESAEYTREDLRWKAEYLIQQLVSADRERDESRSLLDRVRRDLAEGAERSRRKVAHFRSAGLPQLAAAEAQLRSYLRLLDLVAEPTSNETS